MVTLLMETVISKSEIKHPFTAQAIPTLATTDKSTETTNTVMMQIKISISQINGNNQTVTIQESILKAKDNIPN